MRSILLMIGTPGAGKSTVVRRLIAATGGDEAWSQEEPMPLVKIHRCARHSLAVVGNYEPGSRYPGVDRLSMSCQPNVESWIAQSGSNVLIEGDRLSNQKFANFLLSLRRDGADGVRVRLLRVVVSRSIVRQRQSDRGDNRTDQFLQSRETKYDNICLKLATGDSPVEIWLNDNQADGDLLYASVADFLLHDNQPTDQQTS